MAPPSLAVLFYNKQFIITAESEYYNESAPP